MMGKLIVMATVGASVAQAQVQTQERDADLIPTRVEIVVLKDKGADLSPLKAAKRWLHRDDDRVPAAARPQLALARAAHA